jgi:hypothetical protein
MVSHGNVSEEQKSSRLPSFIDRTARDGLDRVGLKYWKAIFRYYCAEERLEVS